MGYNPFGDFIDLDPYSSNCVDPDPHTINRDPHNGRNPSIFSLLHQQRNYARTFNTLSYFLWAKKNICIFLYPYFFLM